MDSPIYVSGPMKGYDSNNYPFFVEVTKKLREMGFEVLSPHEVKLPERPLPTWEDYVRADLMLLLQARCLVMLPGWECSRGARLEMQVAHTLGMPTLPLDQVLRV